MAVEDSNVDGYARDAFVPPGAGGRWPWSRAITTFVGLLLLACAIGAASFWGVQHFESRLDQNVRSDLQAAGIDTGQLSLDWEFRDVTVTGQLAGSSEDQLFGALREADGSGIRGINIDIDAADEKPVEVAFGTVDVTMGLEGGNMHLQGSVLTTAQRDQLQSAAERAIGAAGVKNDIVVSGLKEKTPGSDQRVASLANSIAGLNQAVSADARLSATDFRFNATVADEDQANDLLRLRGTAGDVGLVISGDIVTKKSAPGVIDVAARKENGRIVLSGTVASEAQKDALLTAAISAFDQQSVTDEIVVTEGNDADIETGRGISSMVTAIDYFDDAIDADASLTGTEFTFNALIEFEEDIGPLELVRSNAQQQGFDLAGIVEARQVSLNKQVGMLQAEINALADEIRDTVVFESSKADLDFAAKQTLDKITDAMNRYQRPVVEIIGHTDDSGPEDANQRLSLFRATAVLEYLKSSGIDALRVRAVGMGEASPVASNSTEVGKKQNRRVEFTALGNFGN